MEISLLMGQVLGLCSIAIGGLLISRITKMDITLSAMLSGAIASLGIATFGWDTGLRANHIQELVFFIILPLLIFEATWEIDINILKKWAANSFVLATAGVLISTGLIAVIIFYAIDHPIGFPWIAALLTGAILSATDPVAVTTQLKALKAPKDLGTLFEGESLFNDASAVVLFGIVLTLALQTNAKEESVILHFLMVFFGGIIIGAMAGAVSTALILFMRKPATTLITLIFTAFASFYLAEHVFHVSGIMSVVAAAITLKYCLKNKQKNKFMEGVSITWSWLGLFFTTLIFSLMGLLVSIDMFAQQWLAILIAIVAVTLSRFISVYLCNEFMGKIGFPVPRTWSMMLSWGGLRGAIAIALVLSLPTELDYWYTIQSMVFGVVMFTLLVQGTTTPMLMRKLKLV